MRGRYLLCLIAVGVFAFGGMNPPEVEAQIVLCGWCVQESGSPTIKCTTQAGSSSQLYCEDVFLWFLCVGCSPPEEEEFAYNASSNHVLGRSLGVAVDGRTLAAFGEEVESGVFVKRNSCNDGVEQSWYSYDAEVRHRARVNAFTI